MVKLQVALDFLKPRKAILVANSVSDFFDFIECGTPLIKNNSILVVKKFLGFKKPIVADMKIADTGYLEAEIAFKAGAKYVTVLSVASNETIKSACKAAKDYSCGIIIDFICDRNVEKRYEEIENIDFEYALIHTAIDVQEKNEPFSIFNKMAEKYGNKRLGVVGGINPDNIKHLAFEPSLIVVGSFITKSKDCKNNAKILRNEIWNVLKELQKK